MIRHDDECELTCTNNGRRAQASVLDFKPEHQLSVAIGGNRIIMKYKANSNIYVGNSLGMEFTSPGPKTYNVKTGRF